MRIVCIRIDLVRLVRVDDDAFPDHRVELWALP